MLRSLRKFEPDAGIHVLALDSVCARVVGEIFGQEAIVHTPDVLYSLVPELAALAATRSKWAFYATHKPVLAGMIVGNAAYGSVVTFIDADTWFFNHPAGMFRELDQATIGLSPHRFNALTANKLIYGLYNAGCIYWRACATTRKCLADWQADCLAWCAEEVRPDGRFMNQGYLNRWPERYSGVHIIQHPGVNLAAWNLGTHAVGVENQTIQVDSQPLIFYHYSAICRLADGQWYSHRLLGADVDFAHRFIYGPYLAAVEAQSLELLRTYSIDGVRSVAHLPDGPEWVRIHPSGD